MIVDYHMHLRDRPGGEPQGHYSADRAEEYVEQARAAGVDEVGFTDHVFHFRQTEPLWEIEWLRERCTDDLDEYLGAVDEAKGRVPVVAGSGSNSTDEAIDLSRHAEKAGADAVLVVTPYYNKPTQEGLYQHYKAINEAIGIPILIYNIPGRSVIDMSVDTMKRLFELKNIAGVKDATANMVRVTQQRTEIGPDFNQLSGEDGTALGFNAHGGHGCISVTSNVAPRLCAEFQGACLRGDYATALALNDKLMPLHLALFIETNPSPAKYALSVLGRCTDLVRLPLVPLCDKTKAAVRDAMVHAGLIN